MLICGKRLLQKFAFDKTYWKIRDHCHYTSKYRCATHSICNLKFNVPNEIPILFIKVQIMIIILLSELY